MSAAAGAWRWCRIGACGGGAAAGVWRWCRSGASRVTIEPVLFLYFCGVTLGLTVLQNIVYIKVCVTTHPHGDRSCGGTTDDPAAAALQVESDLWLFRCVCALQLPGILLSIFLGSYSDIHGRQMAMVLPALGQILGNLCLVFTVVYLGEAPMWTVVAACLVTGSVGGQTVCLMVTFSYLADHVTSVEERTVRVSYCEAAIALGALTGNLLCALTIDTTSLWVPLIIIILIYSLHVFYVLWRVEAHSLSADARREKQEKLERIYATASGCCSGPGARLEIPRKLGRTLGAHHFYHTLYTIGRTREGDKRSSIILINFAMLFAIIPLYGDSTLLYLYTKTSPFNWSATTYSYYSVVYFTAMSLNQTFILPVVHRYVAKDNYTLCIIGSLMAFAGGLMVAFASVSSLIYVAVIFKSFINYQGTGLRALLANTVDEDEQGQAYAVIASVQNVSGVCASVLFNVLYKNLIERGIEPGYIFIIGFSTLIVTAATMGYMKFMNHRQLQSAARHRQHILTESAASHDEGTEHINTTSINTRDGDV